MKVVVTESAWTDMVEIGRSIALDKPSRADTFLTELYERCLHLADMPRAFPLIPEKESAGIRRRSFSNYLIFYRIIDEVVEVHHPRRPGL
jgi:toxin ParE1/3/4